MDVYCICADRRYNYEYKHVINFFVLCYMGHISSKLHQQNHIVIFYEFIITYEI